MPRDRQNVGPCTQCPAGEVACTYNHFADAEQRIDSWEHRCLSCSFRETQALRTTAEQPVEGDPTTCPFCGRKAG